MLMILNLPSFISIGLPFFPILESDYKIAGSLLCVPIFLPLGSNFVFVLYKLKQKRNRYFFKKASCRIHVFIFSLERITINSYLKQTSSFAKWGGPTLIQTGLKEANLSSFV